MSFAFLTSAFNRFTGRGDGAVTIPAMDGALRPNARLESSDRIVEIEAPDNIVIVGTRALFSSEKTIFAFDLDGAPPRPEAVSVLDSRVTALAIDPSGTMAVGLADGRIVFPNAPELRALSRLGDTPLKGPTALAFSRKGDLLVCLGSSEYAPGDWQRSLMSLDASGSVWRVDPKTGAATSLARGLAYPYGVMESQDGSVVVSESWRHRLVALGENGASTPRIVLDSLPGYPARLAASSSGGSWLAVAAPRSQLVELVLREPRFRKAMMTEIGDPSLWVAPSLFSRRSFLEPMQGGALKQMGILKPWSPTRSYGLVVRLNAEHQPVESLHSRSDGHHHGVRSCAEYGGSLLSASGGGDAILRSRL